MLPFDDEVLKFLAPLTTDEETLEEGLDILEAAIDGALGRRRNAEPSTRSASAMDAGPHASELHP